MQWDARHLHEIAQFGYFHPTHRYGHCCLAGFFPGQPLLVRLLHELGLGWYVAPLVLSAAFGLVCAVALAKLAALELPGSGPDDRLHLGRRAVLYLVCAPYAMFFFAGYTEAPFLGFALAGWLATRHGRWGWAAVGVGGAALIRVTGLFLAAGLVVEYVAARRRAGVQLLRPAALWLAVPFAIGGYLLWLYAKTGDPNAWSNAQLGWWGRGYADPLTALRNTWDLATSRTVPADIFLGVEGGTRRRLRRGRVDSGAAGDPPVGGGGVRRARRDHLPHLGAVLHSAAGGDAVVPALAAARPDHPAPAVDARRGSRGLGAPDGGHADRLHHAGLGQLKPGETGNLSPAADGERRSIRARCRRATVPERWRIRPRERWHPGSCSRSDGAARR